MPNIGPPGLGPLPREAGRVGRTARFSEIAARVGDLEKNVAAVRRYALAGEMTGLLRGQKDKGRDDILDFGQPISWGKIRWQGEAPTAVVQRRDRDFEGMVRDLYRLKLEVMLEHFARETLEAMSGMEISRLIRSKGAKFSQAFSNAPSAADPLSTASHSPRPSIIFCIFFLLTISSSTTRILIFLSRLSGR